MALQFVGTFILIFMMALFSGLACELFNYEKGTIDLHKKALFVIGFMIGISFLCMIWGL